MHGDEFDDFDAEFTAEDEPYLRAAWEESRRKRGLPAQGEGWFVPVHGDYYDAAHYFTPTAGLGLCGNAKRDTIFVPPDMAPSARRCPDCLRQRREEPMRSEDWGSLGAPVRDVVGDTRHKFVLERTVTNDWTAKHVLVQAPEFRRPWQVEVMADRGTRPADLANALRALADRLELRAETEGPEVLEKAAMPHEEAMR